MTGHTLVWQRDWEDLGGDTGQGASADFEEVRGFGWWSKNQKRKLTTDLLWKEASYRWTGPDLKSNLT